MFEPMPPENPERLDFSSSATFTTALAHFYRGELARSDRWRTRLDTTTNWALTMSLAVVSFGIGNPSAPHVTFLLGILLVIVFLLLEARRYRYYDLWVRRVRLLEQGYLVPVLRQEPVDADMLRELAWEVGRPHLQLTLFSAIITRMNRAYGAIFLILLFAWVVKLYSHPKAPQSFAELVHRAHIGNLGGAPVFIGVGAFTLVLLLLFLASLLFRAPIGELHPRPRRRRAPLWERFARPYELRSPRRPQRQAPEGPAPP